MNADAKVVIGRWRNLPVSSNRWYADFDALKPSFLKDLSQPTWHRACTLARYAGRASLLGTDGMEVG